MNYLFLFSAVMCIGGQFTLSKLYQTRGKSTALASVLFPLIASAFSTFIFAALSGFRLPFHWFSLAMAAGSSCCAALYTVLGIRMMSLGRVAIYTLFVMLGGMFLPFLYGVLVLDEPLTAWKIAGIAVLIAALVLPSLQKGGQRCQKPALFFLLGIVVFAANGFVGIFNKAHQISPQALPVFAFGFWQNAVTCAALLAVTGFLFLTSKDRGAAFSALAGAGRNWWVILLFALVSQSGSVLQLLAARSVEASVMFPVVTGGTIVASAVFGAIFFREKIDRNLFLGLVLSVASGVMFVL